MMYKSIRLHLLLLTVFGMCGCRTMHWKDAIKDQHIGVLGRWVEKYGLSFYEQRAPVEDAGALLPLETAVYMGRPEVLKFLLEARPLPASEGELELLLDNAVAYDEFSPVPIIIDYGNFPLVTYQRLMSSAVEEGAKTVITGIVRDNRVDLSLASVSLGREYLHRAVLAGRLDIVRLLLALGANPSATTEEYGLSPLHCVIMIDKTIRVVMAKALIEAGASINLRNSEGETALDLAFSEKDQRLYTLLKANGARRSQTEDLSEWELYESGHRLAEMFAMAIRDDKLEKVRDMLSDGDLDGPIDPTRNLMEATQTKSFAHYAVQLGRHRIVNLLLANGVKADFAIDGFSLLHECAKANGSKGIAELLIKAGANVNAKDGTGKTPRDYASQHEKTDLFNYLTLVWRNELDKRRGN